MPEEFRHLTPMTIRFIDIDRLDHVNNATYLTYCEQARITYMDDLTQESGLPRIAMIVAKITLEYKRPLVLADRYANVWTRCSRLGNKSFDMEHVITVKGSEEVAATAQIVVVNFDYTTSQSAPISDDWRAFLTDYEPILQV